MAVFLTRPAATSAPVTVYGLSAVHVSDWPLASFGVGHVTDPTFASETLTLASGSTPVFVTWKVYWIVSPVSVRPFPFTSVGVPALFTSKQPARLPSVHDRAVDEVADAQRHTR